METNINPTNQPTTLSDNNLISPFPSKTKKCNCPFLFTRVIILIVLIILISAGAFALGKHYSAFQPQPGVTQIKPNKNPIPSIDPTADWKIYQNKEFKYEVKYPPDLTFTEEKSDIFLFQTTFQKKQTGYLNGFIITITKNDGLENALTYWRWRVVGHVSDKIDKENTIKVNNIDAVRLDYTALDNKNFSFIIVPKGSYNYVIKSSSSEIDQILSTFKFIE